MAQYPASSNPLSPGVAAQAVDGVRGVGQPAQAQQPAHPAIYYPGQQGSATGMTVLLFSPIGTYKTTWAALWPSPVVLSCGSEGGDDSLGVINSIWPHVQAPPTFKVESVAQMKEYVEFVTRNAQYYGWKTIIVDSLTYYVDTWIQDLITLRFNLQKQRGRMKNIDKFQMMMTQQDWGLLEYHIMKELVTQLHNSGCNVIWTALVKEKMGNDGRGGSYVKEYVPDIAGATQRKLPGVCKLVLFGQNENTTVTNPDGTQSMKMQPKYYTTAPNPKVNIRHRYGFAFPYGCLYDEQYGTLPTFQAVQSQIGQFIVQ